MSGKEKSKSVETEVVVETNEPKPEAAEATPYIGKAVGPMYRVIAPQGLNLRADPGLDHRVLKVLPFGSVVEARGGSVIVNDSTWLPVQYGWVVAAFLEPIEAEV